MIFNSFNPCLHFVGRWQTSSADPYQTPHNHGGVGSGYELVQKIEMGNSIRHVWVNIKCGKRVIFGTQFHETLHVPFLL